VTAPRITKAQLARLTHGETVEPKKKRKPQTSMWEHYQRSKRVRCPPGCEDGRRLYAALGEALRALRAHHEAHWSGEWES